MATTFDQSFSASMMRVPYSTANAPSMADSLPSIEFGFDDLRERMARFTRKFDEFIAEGRKQVLEERNQFRRTVAELHEDRKMKQRDIEIVAQQKVSHENSMAREASETAEMHAAISSITDQRDERMAERDRVKNDINNTQKLIAQRLDAQRQHAARLDAQARFNTPELDFWVDYLCMRIEGAGQVDRLKFVFTHIDERDWEKEAWFELCTEKRDYEIKGCRPRLEGDRWEACLERLNENRDLAMFLKGMRELFVEALKQ